MGESNGSWGELAEHSDELAAVWDTYARLPEPGEHPALDALVARKHITIGSLVRIGARLGADDTLAFAFPGGIKFRNLTTGQRWSYFGSEFKALKIVRAAEPCDTVIIAEGETDGAWLSDHYSVDVAIMPNGAKRFEPAYAKQLEGYKRVLVGLDTDEAGEAGSVKITSLIPHAERFTPPANDWCASNGDAPALPEPDELAGVTVGGLFFEDLAGLFRGGVPEPKVMVDDLLYAEGVHWLSGHPGSGKTTLAMHMAITVMLEGRHVVWLDYESGIRATVRRLLACDCPIDLAVESFHYAGWTPNAPQYLAAIADVWPGALVIIDSASKALQLEGLDENSPGEVIRWTGPIVKACKLHELPCVVIDHVAKDATRTARYARGAGSKMADSDVAWFVDKIKPFSRDTAGAIACYQQKDREGCMPNVSWYEIGDGLGKLTLLPVDSPPDENTPDGPAI